MRTLRWVTVLLLSAMIFAVAAEAQTAQQSNCSVLVDQALTLSGFTKALERTVDKSISELTMPGDAPKALVRETKQLMSKELGLGALHTAVREQFVKNCQTDTLKGAIELLQTPELQAMFLAERQEASAEASEEAKAFARELKNKPASPDRIAIMNDLDRSLKMSEHLAEMKIGVMLAMYDGAGINMGIQDNDIELARAMLRSAERKSLLQQNLFTYRNMTDDQVRAYVKLSQRGPFHDFQLQLLTYTGEAFRQGALRMGQQLPAAVKRVKATIGE